MAEDPIIGVDERVLDDAALEALAAAHATPPPRGLRRRILDAARADSARGEAMRATRRWRMIGALAAGLTLVLGGLLARTVHLADEQGGVYTALALTNRDLQARLAKQERTLVELRASLASQGQVLRVMGGARTIEASLAPSDGATGVTGSGRVMVDATTGETAIVLAGMTPAGEGKVYELWAIRGERPPEPAGLFTVGEAGAVATVADRVVLPAQVTTFAVSIEPAGGSSAPTGPIVLVGTVVGRSG